ncbi:HAD hydrolase-like protein [Pseudovibrio sp. Tun.PSC04-5.I4]|uniref:HAD hydrolase-like protein n=1 Tax=Pseudovibrio sp. Tun.PSC04-5.I4 TaxID=1798213 RepID=UPI000883C0D3|nr:HAD hydrolase-like protein [Pseudovibrio sp. Tun.PSC04-5.I4]SDR39050.1 phosphoglycolate phosphatase [Pseudovibrio sp. Tun.PSC04-5.I4]
MRTLLFDLDGTLTDPFVGIVTSVQYALEKLGRDVPPAKDLAFVIGPPLTETLSQLLDTEDEELVLEAVRLYRERYTTIGLYENKRYEGIKEILSEAQARGDRLFVCTSKPWVYAEKIIAHFELDGFFEKTYGCELDMTRGNKVELLAYLLEQEKLDPSKTVMIGDRKHDLIAASENGVASIGVLWGYGSAEELAEYKAGTVVSSPTELATHLAGSLVS